MDLNHWKARFALHLQGRGFSPQTVVSYVTELRAFFAMLREKGLPSLASLTLDHLEAYRQLVFFSTFRGKPLKGATQRARLGAIKCFTRFLHRDGILLMDPGLVWELPKQVRSLPRQVLSERETLTLLEAPDTQKVLGIRDRTILEVFYATGIRNSELRHLTVGDLDREARQLRIQDGKGGKSRLVPVGDEAMAWLEEYLLRVRPQLLRQASQQTLFLSWRGGVFEVFRLCNIVKGYARRAGLTKHVTPHVIRHTCATHMLLHGASLRHVQLLLGHRSVATTEIYTHIELSDLAKVIHRCHPRERMGR